jgi:hypothetical protein
LWISAVVEICVAARGAQVRAAGESEDPLLLDVGARADARAPTHQQACGVERAGKICRNSIGV